MSAPRVIYLLDGVGESGDVRDALTASGIRCTVLHAKTPREIEGLLKTWPADVILADHNPPAFDVITAVNAARRACPDVPVVALSALSGEELAVEIVRAGAADYVHRSRLSRLPLVIQRALREAEERATERAAERATRQKPPAASPPDKGVPYQQIVERAREGIWITDRDGLLTYVNRRMTDMVGFTAEQMLGRSATDFFDTTSRSGEAGLQGLRRRGASDSFEHKLRSKSGGELWTLMSTTPLLNESGVFDGTLAMFTDITDRRRAEKALLQFRQLVERASDLILILGSDWTIRYASPALSTITGYAPAEVLGWRLIDLVLPEDAPSLPPINLLGELKELTERAEFRLLHKSGDARVVEALATSLLDDSDTGAVVLNIRDMTERRLTESLTREKEEVERASHAKNDFLSRMSHELRTPMNAILGFTQVLDMAPDTTPKQRERLELIMSAGRHLLHLINEVLDITRIEAGRVTMSPEPVGAGEVITEALELIRPLADRRHITLQMDGRDIGDRHVLADRQRLKQVLLNLISNAVKYNRDGGLVTVSCEKLPVNRLSIRVTDTGAGIPLASMSRLFEPFERLGAEQQNIEGAGGGLALSKRLVDLMEGSLGVESNAGAGSTFWVELPLVDSPLDQSRYHRSQTPIPFEAISLGKAHTVLYIEDNLSNVRLVEDIFSRWTDIRLLSAMTGSLGLELAREHRPELILLDVNLPDMQGSEVLRRLRDEPETREAPVLIISADATYGQPEQFLSRGARAYLTKPLDVRRLIHLVEEILSSARGAG